MFILKVLLTAREDKELVCSLVCTHTVRMHVRTPAPFALHATFMHTTSGTTKKLGGVSNPAAMLVQKSRSNLFPAMRASGCVQAAACKRLLAVHLGLPHVSRGALLLLAWQEAVRV
jgi:hypothetical protein